MLNSQQAECVSLLKDFLTNNEKCFTVIGYAGTGKTFLIREFVKSIRQKYTFCAPTHKALSVLGSGITIHKLLGYGLDTNILEFNPDSPTFKQVTFPLITTFDLIIIDECSMINEAMFNKLMEYDVKIIFMGDNKQLPPIGEKISKMFTVGNSYQLTKIERTKEDSIIRLSSDIRENKEKEIMYYLNDKVRVSDKASYKFDDEKVLCFTNKAVAEWNAAHKKYHKTESPLDIGDSIILNKQCGEYTIGHEFTIEKIEIKKSKLILNEFWVIETNISRYKNEEAKIISDIKAGKTKWSYYYGVFKPNNLIIDKDLCLGNAITIHKAQGSTYDNVAIDYEDLLISDDFRTLLYVGVTRAKSRLTIII